MVIDTDLISSDNEILNECETFYSNIQALKSMNWKITPWSDGLPADFYRVFWNNLSDCLVNSINHAYEVRQLSVS